MQHKQQKIIIAPSLLAADFAELGEEVKAIEAAGAEWLHLDVMDGSFVPNISFGAPVINALRRHSRLFFDVHLMINSADNHLKAFADAGADQITVHLEANTHIHRTLQQIRNLGKKAGVAINPATNESDLANIIDQIDLVLIMTVNPGFGGQEFIAACLEKITRTRQMINGRQITLQVDGGINPTTAVQAIRAGANSLVAGTAIFANSKQGDAKRSIEMRTKDYRTAMESLTR